YIHNDIEKLGFDREVYEKTFSAADKIVTVSAECEKSLFKNFEKFSKKICVIENITSRKIVFEESKKFDAYPERKETVLCTVGRFFEQKNISLAVEACGELIKRGKNIKWYHIGDGPLKGETEKQISENNLQNIFILLGEKSEPYPYMGQCDIYVQPSLYEGKSIAIDEAKCLCRPIVVTNFSTVHDQITDGVNGLICRMDKKDMADKIEILIDSREERKKLIENLKREEIGNENEIKKLYAIIDG
ncbi:MAG: glycosyltransferase, partial [Acutalibacteraceae bacterium]|nr:glycosyltransferase [Acutalibacteraceae bacterium]